MVAAAAADDESDDDEAFLSMLRKSRCWLVLLLFMLVA